VLSGSEARFRLSEGGRRGGTGKEGVSKSRVETVDWRKSRQSPLRLSRKPLEGTCCKKGVGGGKQGWAVGGHGGGDHERRE